MTKYKILIQLPLNIKDTIIIIKCLSFIVASLMNTKD